MSLSQLRLRHTTKGAEVEMLACGVITVVQEHRFQLLSDDGRRLHFTLAHDAPLGWNELQQLMRTRCRVAITHDAAAPGHTSAAAHAIARMQPGEQVFTSATAGIAGG